MKTVKYGSRIKGRFYLILFIRLELDKILKSGNKARYRIHSKTVFGTPDISIKKKKLAVFVDGCFWHGCKKCYKEPKTNTSFWRKKLEYNKQRRLKVRQELKEKGWNMLEFWEHQVSKDPKKILEKISRHL